VLGLWGVALNVIIKKEVVDLTRWNQWYCSRWSTKLCCAACLCCIFPPPLNNSVGCSALNFRNEN
jgi:hypothetical protein